MKTAAATDENKTPTEIALLTERERFVRIKSVISAQGCDQARQVVNATPTGSERVAVLSLLARKCEDDAQRERATALFVQAQQEVPTIRDPADQARARVNLVRQLAATGRSDEALIVARQIENRDLRVDALVRLAHGDVESGNTDRAIEIVQTLGDQERAGRVLALIARKFLSVGQVDQATAIIEKTADASTRTKLYLEVARTHAQDGSIEQAHRFLARAQQALGRLAASERTSFLSTLVREYLANGDVAQALGIARGVSDAQVRVGLFSAIATQEVSAGRLEQAAKLANEIEDPVARTEVFSEIVDQYVHTGRYDNAFLVASTVAVPDTQVAFIVKAAQGELTYLLAKEGREQNASATLTQLLDDHADARLNNDTMMSQVVRAYLEIGFADRTVQLLPFMNASREKALLCAELVKIYAMRGEEKNAERMFVRAFQEATGLADEEEREKAVTQVSILLTSVSPGISNSVLRNTLRKVVEQISEQKVRPVPITKNG